MLNAFMLNLRNIEPRKRTNSRYQAEVDKPYSANLLWKHIEKVCRVVHRVSYMKGPGDVWMQAELEDYPPVLPPA
jgi:hypothetical protein